MYVFMYVCIYIYVCMYVCMYLSIYVCILHDPTAGNNETTHKVISRLRKENLLSKNISEGLKTENPKTPHHCLNTKILKEGNS